jgi:hypothetical protein
MLYIANYGSSGSGTVTSIATGTGLTGGTITGTGTISLSTELAPMATLTGNSLKYLRVNAAETAVEYATVSGGTPAGSDTQIQFNDGGAFGGDVGLLWNKITDTLTVGSGTGIITSGQKVSISSGGDGYPTEILSSNGTSASSSGGSVVLSSGNGAPTGTSQGGLVEIYSGFGGSSGGAGGDILMYAGGGVGANDGGNIEIGSGSNGTSGVNGQISFFQEDGDYRFSKDNTYGTYATLNTSSITSTRTFTFPDESGTLVVTPTVSDFEITDTTKGLIIKSPDGTRWRLGITNAGELTATSL